MTYAPWLRFRKDETAKMAPAHVRLCGSKWWQLCTCMLVFIALRFCHTDRIRVRSFTSWHDHHILSCQTAVEFIHFVVHWWLSVSVKNDGNRVQNNSMTDSDSDWFQCIVIQWYGSVALVRSKLTTVIYSWPGPCLWSLSKSISVLFAVICLLVSFIRLLSPNGWNNLNSKQSEDQTYPAKPSNFNPSNNNIQMKYNLYAIRPAD